MHEAVAKPFELVAVVVEFSGTANALREHDDGFVIGEHLGAVDRVSEHGAHFIQQVAQPGHGWKKAFNHGPWNAGVFFPGGKGIANQQAVDRKLATVIGNNEHRPLGGNVFHPVRLYPEVLFVNLFGERKPVLHGFVVIAPWVVAQAPDGFADAVDMLIQFRGNESGFQKRCQAHDFLPMNTPNVWLCPLLSTR